MNKATTSLQNKPYFTAPRPHALIGGKMCGMATAWSDAGTKWQETMWRGDERHGVEQGWHENGQRRYEQTYRTDERHGVETHWHENGQKEWEIYYIAGEESPRIEWDEKGNMIIIDFLTNRPKGPSLD